MHLLGRISYYVGCAWCGLLALLILISLMWTWYHEGFARVQEIWSPFNLWNTVLTVVCAAPGMALMAWGEKISAKAREPR